MHTLFLTESSDVYAEYHCQECPRALAITPNSFQVREIGDYNEMHEFDASLMEFEAPFDV